MPRRAQSPLAHAPLAALVEALRGGARGLEPYVADVLDRVERLEPTLRALVPEADREARLMAAAAELAERYPTPAARPPLFGAMVGIKDIVAVDGLPTRAGSALPAEVFAMPEATVVTRLREAGALILGKTVTAEFASASPGATTNPHDPSRSPGGSSSGSAAGVAAGYMLLAVGSQTGGSVIRPAAFCGIIGFKPSFGRIPIDGTLYHAPSVDTLGLFTQDIDGMALAASVVVDGWNAAEPLTRPPVLGVPDGPYLTRAEPAALEAFEATVRDLASSGVEIRRVPFLEDAEEVNRRHSRLMLAEFADVHRAYFAQWGALYAGISAANVDEGNRVSAGERQAGIAGRLELRGRVQSMMDREGLDAIICPAARGPAPRGLSSTGDPVMNAPWTHAGVPAITLPAGALESMPLGLQIVGRFGDDEALLATASTLSYYL